MWRDVVLWYIIILWGTATHVCVPCLPRLRCLATPVGLGASACRVGSRAKVRTKQHFIYTRGSTQKGNARPLLVSSKRSPTISSRAEVQKRCLYNRSYSSGFAHCCWFELFLGVCFFIEGSWTPVGVYNPAWLEDPKRSFPRTCRVQYSATPRAGLATARHGGARQGTAARLGRVGRGILKPTIANPRSIKKCAQRKHTQRKANANRMGEHDDRLTTCPSLVRRPLFVASC